MRVRLSCQIRVVFFFAALAAEIRSAEARVSSSLALFRCWVISGVSSAQIRQKLSAVCLR